MSDGRVKHGLAPRHNKPPEFGIWCKMRERCNNPKNSSFKNYGARGITVCERWENNFDSFLADMGKRPSADHTIERKNNNEGYGPHNCTWILRKDQGKNRRPPKKMENCRRGHSLSGLNLYIRPDGKRACKTCRRQNMREFLASKKKGIFHANY